MEILIEKIVYPGRSLGRGEDGIAVFTEGGLPGEKLEVKIVKNKKSFKEAKFEKLLTVSEKRTAPRCPSFGSCGGCTFQHTSYDNQLYLKSVYTKELLSPFGVEIEAVRKSPEEWGYRNKMEFSFFDDKGQLSVGLHQRGEFNRYVSVPPCFIADADFIPITAIVIDFARRSGFGIYDKRSHSGFFRHLVLRKGKNTGEVLVNLVTNKDEKVSEKEFDGLVEKLKGKAAVFYWTVNASASDAVRSDELKLLFGATEIIEKLSVGDKLYSFKISPFSFFQTNTLACEKLYETVIELFVPDQNNRLLDLYCGTGTIGMVLAPFVKEVIGVDEIESAVMDAGKNAAANGIENIKFETAPIQKWIKGAEAEGFNSVILDPPRCGATEKILDFIGEKGFKKIVYVSCNPSTLARDLKLLTEKHSFRIKRIVPVDMFPQTFHVETVVSLER